MFLLVIMLQCSNISHNHLYFLFVNKTSVKRVVWNSSSFTETADASNVKVVEVKPCEIDEINKALGIDQVFKDASLIQGTAKSRLCGLREGENSSLPLDVRCGL